MVGYTHPDFYPLGIHSFKKNHNLNILAVVNFRKCGQATVEMFHHFSGENVILHKETIIDKLITHPNSILMTTENEFYLTNDSQYDGGVIKKIEQWLRFKSGNVVYRDARRKIRVVAKDLSWANGITMNKEEKLVFVGETSRGVVNIYERTFSNGLRSVDKIKLVFSLDKGLL